MATPKSHCKNNNTRQRRRAEMSTLATRTLLALTVAALFAVSNTSAFNVLQSPSTTPIRPDGIDHQQRQHYRTTTSPAVAATAPIRSRATTLLLASPLDSQDDDSRVSFGKRLHSWKCWIQFWNTETFQNFSRRRQARAVAASLLSAGSIASILGGAPAPAYARTLQDTMEEGTQIYSLRPGVSREQAEQLSSGVMPDEVRDNIDSKTKIGTTTGLSKEESAAKAKKTDTLYGDYDDYDDEDYAADEEEFGESAYGNTMTKQRQKSFSSETDASSEISKGTKQTFTGISSDVSKTKPTSLYAKIGAACFVPTFGLFGVRDFIRTRTEERNVAKAIEIMDAQRGERFGVDKDGKNITETETSDSDIEDELKDLKDGDDDDDDEDDEEEDDDDEEDEPPRRRRSLPKPPKGPQGDGSGGGFDGFDDDDDDDGPSDEDIARLGDIFNKS